MPTIVFALLLFFLAACNQSPTQTPPADEVNQPPAIKNVKILIENGSSAFVGSVLLAEYEYFDAEGDQELAVNIQWYRDGIAIDNALQARYVVTRADLQHALSVGITPIAATGTADGVMATSTDLVQVYNSAPYTAQLLIASPKSTVFAGDELLVHYEYIDVDGDVAADASVQWLRDGVAINGATSEVYTLLPEDSGHLIGVRLQAHAQTGEIDGAWQVSPSEILIANAAPQISELDLFVEGTTEARVGASLSFSYQYADLENDPAAAPVISWLRDGEIVANVHTANYLLSAADSGHTISVKIAPIAVSGTSSGVPLESNALLVENSAPIATSLQVINTNGSQVIVGSALRAQYSYIDADLDIEHNTVIQWYRNDQPIGGANTALYTVTQADANSQLHFSIAPGAASGIAQGQIVTADRITVVNSAPSANNVYISHDGNEKIRVGSLLHANYQYGDKDGDVEKDSLIQWYVDGAAISGATALQFQPRAQDSGKTVNFSVTPAAQSGVLVGSTVNADAVEVFNSQPVATDVQILDDNGGTYQVGTKLQLSYQYVDVDNDVQGDSAVQWYRDQVKITGANALSYTITPLDLGKTLSVSLVPKAQTGELFGETVTISLATVVQNSLPVASQLATTFYEGDSLVVGSTLEVSYVYADADGDQQAVAAVQWLRDDVVISGAESYRYTLHADDSGALISVKVQPQALTGASPGVWVDLPVGTVINSKPVASSLSIADDSAGNVQVGSVLSAQYVYGDVDGDALLSSNYQWLSDGVAIASANTQNYTVQSADSGKLIQFKVQVQSDSGGANASSDWFTVPGGVRVNNSAPVVSNPIVSISPGNTAMVGSTLSASYDYSDADADAEGASIIQWTRDGVAIPAAGASQYTVIAADSGHALGFRLTPIALTGTTQGASLISDTVLVANSAPVVSNAQLIDGESLPLSTALVGQTLRVTYSYSDPDGDAQAASSIQWLREKDGSNTLVQTGSYSYTVSNADLDAQVFARVTPRDSQGNSGEVLDTALVTILHSKPLASNVSIKVNGNAGAQAMVGDVLEIAYQFSDVDADAEAGSTFRWYEKTSAGLQALALQSTSYELMAGDSGRQFVASVTPADAYGDSGEEVFSAAMNVVNSAPEISALQLLADGDAIAADLVTGQLLSASYQYSDADGDLETNTEIKWYRKQGSVESLVATGPDYLIAKTDPGAQLRVSVLPVDAQHIQGQLVYSPWYSVVNSAPVVSDLVLHGNAPARLGEVLSISYHYDDIDGDAESASLISWYRDGVEIAAASQQSNYQLQIADINKQIMVKVTPQAQSGALLGTLAQSNVVTVQDEILQLNVLAQVKRLDFSWNKLPTISDYRLSENPDGSSGYQEIQQTNLSQWSYDLTAFEKNWFQGRYVVEACDASACIASNELNPKELRSAVVAYIKAGHTGVGDNFGSKTALSGDGSTLAVAAIFDDSMYGGVNSPDTCLDGLVDCAEDSGAVYIYRKINGQWSDQIDKIKAPIPRVKDYFGNDIQLSHDGSLVVISARNNDSAESGVGAGESCLTGLDSCAQDSGAVYLYSRVAGSYSHSLTIKSPQARAGDNFGHAIALSGNGRILAVGANNEDSAAQGINAVDLCNPISGENCLTDSGAVYLYELLDGTWTYRDYLKAQHSSPGDSFGYELAINNDGNRLLVSSYREDSSSSGPGAEDTCLDNAADCIDNDSGAVIVFDHVAGQWQQSTMIKGLNPAKEDGFGRSVAISADGNTMAVGVPYDDHNQCAIDSSKCAQDSGGVYYYKFENQTWQKKAYIVSFRYLKAEVGDLFGFSVALSADGNRIAIGAPGADLLVVGANAIVASPAMGIVQVMDRQADGNFSYAHVGSKNIGSEDKFGASLSMDASGKTLSVGAIGEDGMNSGFNTTDTCKAGSAADQCLESSGAVYLY